MHPQALRRSEAFAEDLPQPATMKIERAADPAQPFIGWRWLWPAVLAVGAASVLIIAPPFA